VELEIGKIENIRQRLVMGVALPAKYQIVVEKAVISITFDKK
jgi:hypothetical protein